jgi:nicotinamidase-related amidase
MHLSAVIFDKTVYSAFGDPQLHQHLGDRQIDILIISGSETDVCVLSSALAAVGYGYRVIAEDAVCSSSDEGHDALLGLFKIAGGRNAAKGWALKHTLQPKETSMPEKKLNDLSTTP